MFIAIEGIDGSGKNTQTQRLRYRFETAGYSTGTLSFPRYGKTLMARSIADYLNGKFGDLGTLPAHFPALLYATDRFESLDLLRLLTTDRDIVLSDRYVASNLAHQGAKLPSEIRVEFIQWLVQVEHDIFGLPRADLTVFLDVPVNVAVDLIAKKRPRDYTDAKADLHEKNRIYLAACRDVYRMLCSTAMYGSWIYVDCVGRDERIRSESDIHEEVWDAVQCFSVKQGI